MIKPGKPVRDFIEHFKNSSGKWCQNTLPMSWFKDRDSMKKWSVDARMNGDNKKLFKGLFGMQHFCHTSWYRSWNWVFIYENYAFLVQCSKRGTSYWVYPEFYDKPETRKPLEEVTMNFYKEFMNYKINIK